MAVRKGAECIMCCVLVAESVSAFSFCFAGFQATISAPHMVS
jgi:hypothetical protein